MGNPFLLKNSDEANIKKYCKKCNSAKFIGQEMFLDEALECWFCPKCDTRLYKADFERPARDFQLVAKDSGEQILLAPKNKLNEKFPVVLQKTKETKTMHKVIKNIPEDKIPFYDFSWDKQL